VVRIKAFFFSSLDRGSRHPGRPAGGEAVLGIYTLAERFQCFVSFPCLEKKDHLRRRSRRPGWVDFFGDKK
jgi:hypothetical protein